MDKRVYHKNRGEGRRGQGPVFNPIVAIDTESASSDRGLKRRKRNINSESRWQDQKARTEGFGQYAGARLIGKRLASLRARNAEYNLQKLPREVREAQEAINRTAVWL